MSLQKNTISGIGWKFMEKICSQGISLIVQIILARILLPAEFGIVGYMVLFINLCDVFLLQGFSTALIQKKDADEIDYSSVFFANIIMSLIIYMILYLIAPWLSRFYHEPQIISIMRVMSLTVVIGSFSAVHCAIMSKTLDFKKSFFRGLANIIVYAIVGISLANSGYGAWSLVWAKLAGVAVGSIVLLFTVKWKPILAFSMRRIKILFNFSSKVLSTNLLNTLFNNINSIIIGRFYTSSDMGFYQRGQSIPQAAMQAIDGSLSEVMYPAFSILQNDVDKLKSAMRRTIKTSTYIVFPLLIGLMVLSKPLTLFLLTEKWLDSVPFMQLTCISCMFWPLASMNHALNAIGKSDITLKLSVLSKCITLIILIISARFGIIYILYGNIISSIISIFITSYYVEQNLGYTLRELLVDILPNLCLSFIMGGIVFVVSCIGINVVLVLFSCILIGVLVYLVGSFVFKIESAKYLILIIKQFLNRKK